MASKILAQQQYEDTLRENMRLLAEIARLTAERDRLNDLLETAIAVLRQLSRS